MITTRRASPGDIDAVAALHTRSWRESYRGEFSDAYLDGDLLGERRAVWRERLEQPVPNQLVQLAHDGEELVGFVCAYGGHDPDWGSFVDNLHVVSRAKRRGVGRSLMQEAGRWLDERHPEQGVYLLVLASNANARRFYELLGGRSAEVSRMETHGGATVQSCRYIWAHPAILAAAVDA